MERISNGAIEAMLVRSFQPARGPFPFEGLEPYFPPIVPLTLSTQCCESFMRSYPDLPIESRDYYLSKLFQFLLDLWAARFGINEAERFSYHLQESLDGIPVQRLRNTDWSVFWFDCYDDCVAGDKLEAVVDLFERRLGVALKPCGAEPSKRRPGPKPDLQRLRLIARVIAQSTRNGPDWRDSLYDVCKALDQAGISTSDGQGAKVFTSWSTKLKAAGGPDKVRKGIQYALKRAPDDERP